MRRKKTKTNPWGAVFGLSAWCMATLIGVWSGLEPDEILLRAVVAGVAVGLMTSILAWFLKGLLIEESQRRK